ncbi:hypothetical protein Ddye_013299 [Dipteronia dyeriana]|uniref:Uncharacterized protein n=1 Tax=Dipteronia dyeriana TaxID=168575 RepID=A0AAE0CK34_9ROSI|nr:hypothetical protein Ddye_013299 [Dipteronia dyeriana]
MDVKEFEEDEEFYEIIKHLLMAIQAVVHVLNEFMIVMSEQHVERPLTRRQITTKGLNYILNVLNQDSKHFRQSHNNRYCLVCDTFNRSHFTTSKFFNKVLKALNTIKPNMLVKPGSLPSKLRESTRFFPCFKDCIGGIDDTRILAMIIGHDVIRCMLKYLYCIIRTQTTLVSACVGLHNFLQKECRPDEFSIEQDNEVDPELVNEVDPELVFQTQEQERTELRMEIYYSFEYVDGCRTQ